MFIHSSFFPCTKLMVWRLEDMQNYKATLLRRFQVLQTETCICLSQQIQNPMRSWWLVTWIEFLFFWLSSLASYKGRAYIHISMLFVFRTNTLPFTKLPRNHITKASSNWVYIKQTISPTTIWSWNSWAQITRPLRARLPQQITRWKITRRRCSTILKIFAGVWVFELESFWCKTHQIRFLDHNQVWKYPSSKTKQHGNIKTRKIQVKKCRFK